MPPDDVSVKTYSGRAYTERPLSFVWQDTEYQIREIERTWLEPGERHFSVRTGDGHRFHLWYDEAMDAWKLSVED